VPVVVAISASEGGGYALNIWLFSVLHVEQMSVPITELIFAALVLRDAPPAIPRSLACSRSLPPDHRVVAAAALPSARTPQRAALLRASPARGRASCERSSCGMYDALSQGGRIFPVSARAERESMALGDG